MSQAEWANVPSVSTPPDSNITALEPANHTTTEEDYNTTTGPLTAVPIGPIYPLTPCLWILVKFIGNTYVVPWDIFLLVPNAVVFLLLLLSARRSIGILRKLSSPIVTTFYILVCLTCFFSTVRCIVIMFVSGFNALHNQILWLVVRFFQLVTELSVLILALIYGQADSRTGIRRVLIITITLSLLYTVCQFVLEKMFHKVYFDRDIYLHGGLKFTQISTATFSVIYFFVSLLPFMPLQRFNLLLPKKRSFYIYSMSLCVLNILGCVGSSLVDDYNEQTGFCFVSVTMFVYFSLFPPMIYIVFLQPFLGGRTSEGQESNNETSRLLSCNYGVQPQLNYSSSSVANARKGISVSQSSTSTPVVRSPSQGSLIDSSYPGQSVADVFSPPNIYKQPTRSLNDARHYDSSSGNSDNDEAGPPPAGIV
ncbi:transmembrane protein adipocyte-associated 1 homolog [Sycon ciliatum]|uniref:transmembrane protein adipocyte-associated 1 homolog n=1 Tax=Sycon ciliatum TaxID=27933 RepID=UPI0020ABFD76|eukprot:scpid79139/ scgid22391/ Transmembrane protein adipocyte-associated 1; Integral membrane protein GPR175; TPRA40; Transmembrane domain protein of 40 kDa regulated in adipocytes &gt; Transmembrane protein adipocyte-associated 1; Integral membrane protein GPR175; TPRA40; Transmembrane domain protein of 40 kDa regulated in adipocytes